MQANNFLLDYSFISDNSEEISMNISYNGNQSQISIFENEFEPEIIYPILQNSRPKFKSEQKRIKRGRPNITNKRKKEHSSSDMDNIISKIQTHFLTFIIFFLNDSVNEYYKEQKFTFLNFSHKEKSKVSFDYLNEIKNSTIGDLLLKMHISPKYKRCKDTNINQNNLKQLEQNSFFENLFKIKYLDLFSVYYNNQQPLKELKINEIKIKLSPKTMSFSALLQKDEKLKHDIIDVAKKFYLNDNNIIKEGDFSERII